MPMKQRQTLNPKIMLNVGGLKDIPTGRLIFGEKGEGIINGGIHGVISVVGIGNNFKSTLINDMVLTCLSRYGDSMEGAFSYDTEVNMVIDDIERQASRYESIDLDTLFDSEEGRWSVTNKTEYYADEWISLYQDYADEKKKNKSKYIEYQGIKTADGKPLKLPKPEISVIDSFTEFEGEATAKMRKQKAMDDPKNNTIFMKQGLLKAKFMADLPVMTNMSNLVMMLTAQVGKKSDMNANPAIAAGDKKLQQLKNGDVVKGVSDKFFFFCSVAWQAKSTVPLINQNTKLPEFPRDRSNADQYSEELNLVRLTQLRCKSGPTGYTLEQIASQDQGILKTLTEFYFLKTNRTAKKFGIEGSDTNYYISLLPEIKLSRTTIRSKIEENPRLRRAINICSEILQARQFWSGKIDVSLFCTPKELYEDLKAKGYDWDVLLDTRGYYVPNQYTHPVPFLSFYDLLRMRKDEYVPYWMDK